MSTKHELIAEHYAAALERVLNTHLTQDRETVQVKLDERQPLIDIMEADLLSVLTPEHRELYVAVMEQTALDAIWWYRDHKARQDQA